MRTLPLLLLTACQTALHPPVPVPEADPSPAWEALLARVVTPDGYVDYPALQADHAALDAYVAWLARDGALTGDPAADHATWLNAYNAWVLFTVLETGVPDSVRDVPGWLPQPGSGFFLERTHTLDGRRVSLYVAEHQDIRRGIGDWRDHAALNCASASCPPLRAELYRAADLDAQLDDQVRRWMGDPDRGWFVQDDRVVFNPIVDWYAADFPGPPEARCALFAPFLAGERRETLNAFAARGCPHTTFTYDWRLNRPGVRGERPTVP